MGKINDWMDYYNCRQGQRSFRNSMAEEMYFAVEAV